MVFTGKEFPRLWVIDIEETGDTFPPFVFFLYDPDEAVVLSHRVAGDMPPENSLVIGAIHEAGVEPAIEWWHENEDELRKHFGDILWTGGDDDES